MAVILFLQVFRDNMAVEQMDHPVGIIGIGRRVGDHYNGGAPFVQIHQNLHDFIAMGGIQVTRGLICQNHFWIGNTARATATRCCCPPDIC